MVGVEGEGRLLKFESDDIIYDQLKIGETVALVRVQGFLMAE